MAPTKEQLDERYKKGVQKIQNELAQLVADGGKQENQATSPREAIKGKITALNTEKFQADQLKIRIDKFLKRQESILGEVPTNHSGPLANYLQELGGMYEKTVHDHSSDFLQEMDKEFKKLPHFK